MTHPDDIQAADDRDPISIISGLVTRADYLVDLCQRANDYRDVEGIDLDHIIHYLDGRLVETLRKLSEVTP